MSALDVNAFASPATAFVAGLVTSVHCAGMCGPLACAVFGRSGALSTPAAYHISRALAYSLVGGLLASAGWRATELLSSSPARLLPWAFAILFLAFAFGLEKKLPQPKALSRLLLRLRIATLKPGLLATTLGTMTPMLPCGPLYLAFGVALFAGSFAAGALLMASFALGTIPLPFLLHVQFNRIPFSALWLRRVQRALAFVSALLLMWRAIAGSAGIGFPMLCH